MTIIKIIKGPLSRVFIVEMNSTEVIKKWVTEYEVMGYKVEVIASGVSIYSPEMLKGLL